MNKFFLIVFSLIIWSCKVDPKINLAPPTDNLVEVIPQGWPQPYYTFSVNTISEDKFILGRALFYESMLSKDNTISCGSCHEQFVAFAHSDHDVSHGINGLLGIRNSPALFNLNWHSTFMHDGGINHIEVMPLAPITNPIEMGEDINSVIQKLLASEKYRNLFKNAYGTEEINTQKMFRAMAQFMGLMYSYNSKYDYFKRGEGYVEFTDAEKRGYNLFLAKCNSCHKEPLFSDFQFRNNGLSVNVNYRDSGRQHITREPQDLYKFKTPSLRNIARTGPYMHDGRFSTLKQCLDHYTNGITNMTNIDPLLQSGSIQLSAQDKDDIIAFLNTLTDYKFLGDKRFKYPNFK
jgi:cytochrome c peroxidase